MNRVVFRLLSACLALVSPAVCPTTLAALSEPAPVRKVDYSAAADLKEAAEHVRQTANLYYPAVCALLADGRADFPRQFDICFKKKLPPMHAGETRLRQICLDVRYLEQVKDEPAALDHLVVHELAHVAQHYYRPILGHWLVWGPNLPACWREGIAAYACFKLGLTNGWECASCAVRFPHYRNGYSCAGAFLLYAESTYNPNLVRQLNTVLCQGHYSDDFFRAATGRDLPTLWAEFQKTSAFTPGAARMLELQQALGFVNGEPPKDFQRRLARFLDEHTDAATRQMIQRASFPGLAFVPGNAQACLALVCYFTQPGGSAEAYMVSLDERGGLPGFKKGEKASLTFVLSPRTLSAGLPAERSFTATRSGDPSTYHYTIARVLQESPWQLRRAWRTDAHGRLAEEYRLQ